MTGYYSNDHAVNLLMEVEGRLMADKPRLLASLDRYLALPEAERDLYAVGRRLNTFGCLDDLQDAGRRAAAREQVVQLEARYPGMREEVCHHLRERVV